MNDAPEQVKKDYELGFLARDHEGIRQGMEVVRRYAEVTKEGDVKEIALAYKIKRETRGFFGFVVLRMAPAAAKELENELRLHSPFLRTLLVILPKKQSAAAPVPAGVPAMGRPRGRRPYAPAPAAEPLSNEALSKKIEEILQ